MRDNTDFILGSVMNFTLVITHMLSVVGPTNVTQEYKDKLKENYAKGLNLT